MVTGEDEKKSDPILIAVMKDHQGEVARYLRLRRFEELQYAIEYRSGTLE
jgi:hypothetical protein